MSDDRPWLDLDRRPEGVSDAVVEAVGKVGEALEWIERARGRLYDFHQMSGHADLTLGEAADLLDDAGATDLAARLRHEIVGLDVLENRWTFQIVEEYDTCYWDVVRAFVADVRAELTDGVPHVYEAEMKVREQST